MNEQELNKKLAEWAGFEVFEFMDGYRIGWYAKGKYLSRKGFKFTQSLDACFKWLVPKLDSYTLVSDKRNEHQAVVRKSGMGYHGAAKTLALALCLAIEKLTDGG